MTEGPGVPADAFPQRYEPVRCLGAGGGGQVWEVRDRALGGHFALKVLSPRAGKAEIDALVHEASALSGLEGLGVPRVVAFGVLPDGRRYLVREIVSGKSLDEVLQSDEPAPWLSAIASASDQLTVVHRSGLLHGDIKPANIIVGEGGRGTLVDLGLASPWRERGTIARGMTPKYAAPELLEGKPLTVRAEVYSMGATLGEALARRGDDLNDAARIALGRVVACATETSVAARWPSVDEFASALRRAAGLPDSAPPGEAPWPILGLGATAHALIEKVRALGSGEAIALEGPIGAGCTTLVQRLAWTLGVEGTPVVVLDGRDPSAASDAVARLELEDDPQRTASSVVIIDHAEQLPDASAATRAAHAGARLVVVGSRETTSRLARGATFVFEVPPLQAREALELLSRSMPSLPDGLQEHLIERTGCRPGPLRAAVRALSGHAVVTRQDVDAILDRPAAPPDPSSADPGAAMAAVEKAIAMGRFDDAARRLVDAEAACPGLDPVRRGIAAARVALGRGDTAAAVRALDPIADAARAGPCGSAWKAVRARVHLRAGEYVEANRVAREAVDGAADDSVAADAMSTRGVALAFTGEHAQARLVLEEAVRIAEATSDPRVLAVALGSAAIAHQRAGRTAEAKAAYESSLSAAERANDAATVAADRLNLAGIAQSEGDLAAALLHLEAAVDMGRRAGSTMAVTQALLNLANLDLYLGRWARAQASIERLAADRDAMSSATQAQLLGLEAQHESRTGDVRRAAALYERAAERWDQQGRGLDATESRLEGMLVRAREDGANAEALAGTLEGMKKGLAEGAIGELAPLADLLRGVVAQAVGDEDEARRRLDAAVEQAQKSGRREYAWQALDARARLSASQGALATANRDAEAALAMLEETAAKLPRDLREVFWNDPRRRRVRQAHRTTHPPAPMGAGHAYTHAGTASVLNAARSDDGLARILEITRELATERDLPKLLERVTAHAVALLSADRGMVVLVGPGGELEAHAARFRAGNEEHARFSRSVADAVLQTGEAVVTNSAPNDARLSAAVSVHQLAIQSIACVPIRGAPPLCPTIGALYLETGVRTGARFEQELPTLRAFADQAAIAIENARLLAENGARAEALSKANAELSAARDQLSRLLGKRTEQLADVRRDLKQVRAEIRSHFGYDKLVGTSAAMRRVYAVIDRVKDIDVPVLITGESGTGKEVIARAIHQVGPRAKRPFIGLNCGAIPANLLESELFGSVKGAFTGADRDRRGLFQESSGGTILLDEIGELPQKMQVGLLRVLQEKTVRPVGGNREEPVDVRVLAATNRDLGAMVAGGTFREDLYYRLDVIELHVPPLRERIEDMPSLIDHFLSLFAARYRRQRKTLTREALRKACAYPWPGNVRQLEHVLMSAWLMSDEDEIGPDDIELPSPTPARSLAPAAHASAQRTERHPSLSPSSLPHANNQAEFKAAERDRILAALTACNWNRAKAAKMLGLPRRTFYRRLNEFGIL